jgi:hypothetical protein
MSSLHCVCRNRQFNRGKRNGVLPERYAPFAARVSRNPMETTSMNVNRIVATVVLLLCSRPVILLAQPSGHTDTIIVYQPYPHFPRSLGSYPGQIIVRPLIKDDTIRCDVGPQLLEGPLASPQSIRYPDLALRAGIDQGRVLFKTSIGIDGLPRHIKTLWFDYQIHYNVAIDAITKTKFLPARFNGNPVEVSVLVEMYFTRTEKAHSLDWLLIDASEISLTRTPSMGGGPVYTVVLRKDGTASFDGSTGVARLGTFQGQLASYYYKNLERLLGWFSFFDTTVTYTAATCVGYDIVSAVSNGKRVTMYTDGHDERIWAIARIIDQMADRYIIWQKIK